MRILKISRESALQELAVEIDKALRIPPVAHIKHMGVPDGDHGIACLESHLLGFRNRQFYSLHDWGYYGDEKAKSLIIPEAPRGFMVTLKTDSLEENKLRGRNEASIPTEAKTLNYTGDYLKIDWIYPHQEILGLGFVRRYFYAVERAAKKVGYPSLHIDATDNGLSYWARKEFNLKIPEESHDSIIELYQHFKANAKENIQKVRAVSGYINAQDAGILPEDIDPKKPHTIPRIFMDVLGTLLRMQRVHLHFYKKI